MQPPGRACWTRSRSGERHQRMAAAESPCMFLCQVPLTTLRNQSLSSKSLLKDRIGEERGRLNHDHSKKKKMLQMSCIVGFQGFSSAHCLCLAVLNHVWGPLGKIDFSPIQISPFHPLNAEIQYLNSLAPNRTIKLAM